MFDLCMIKIKDYLTEEIDLKTASISEIEKIHKLYLVTFKDVYPRYINLVVQDFKRKNKKFDWDYATFVCSEYDALWSIGVSQDRLDLMRIVISRLYKEGKKNLLKKFIKA